MTDAIVALQEANAAIYARMKDFQGKKADAWSAEDQTNWDALNADYNRNKEEMDRLKRIEQVRLDMVKDDAIQRDKKITPPEDVAGPVAAPTYGQRALAFQGWIRSFHPEKVKVSKAHRAAMTACGVRDRQPEIELPLCSTQELRGMIRRGKMNTWERLAAAQGLAFRADDLSTVTNDGGETIPEGFMANWEMALLAYGGMRSVAEIIRTETGNDLPWPTTDDTGNTGELPGEGSASTEQGTTTSSMTLQAWKYSSKIFKVSSELMQDSAFNLAAEIGRMMAERIARIQNTHFTTGDASSKPNGIVTAAADSGVTAASSTTYTGDELIDIVHSVDPAYRIPNGTGWMMNDTTVKAIRKILVAAEAAHYAWQPGMQAGLPDMLFGFPVTINQDMASPATTAKTIVFGQLNKYKIRDAGAIRVRRTDDLYLATDQVGFVAFQRSDGDLLDAGTNPVKWADHT